MKIQTFSVVTPPACTASCPWCVSHLTGLPTGSIAINECAFHKAARLAQVSGTTTVLITGKGEPTLYVPMVARYLELLLPYQFPFIECQSNALDIGWIARDGRAKDARGLDRAQLERWHAMGLNTMAISAVHYRSDRNALTYLRKHRAPTDYPDLARTADFLHELGYTVRLCIMMQRGDIDTPERVSDLLAFCQEHRIEQLKLSPIRRPKYRSYAQDDEAYRAAMELGITERQIARIADWIRQDDIARRLARWSGNGTLARWTDLHSVPHQKLMQLMHGAEVFDIGGQNVCLADCLTIDPRSDDIRTLIFFWDGEITYDWQFPGAVLLGGRERHKPKPPTKTKSGALTVVA